MLGWSSRNHLSQSFGLSQFLSQSHCSDLNASPQNFRGAFWTVRPMQSQVCQWLMWILKMKQFLRVLVFLQSPGSFVESTLCLMAEFKIWIQRVLWGDIYWCQGFHPDYTKYCDTNRLSYCNHPPPPNQKSLMMWKPSCILMKTAQSFSENQASNVVTNCSNHMVKLGCTM